MEEVQVDVTWTLQVGLGVLQPNVARSKLESSVISLNIAEVGDAEDLDLSKHRSIEGFLLVNSSYVIETQSTLRLCLANMSMSQLRASKT